MLLQDNEPVAFASKSLTETECRYANIERELLAVVCGCERFHTYIYGSNFVVETDHKPLEMISLKNLTSAPPRLQRMLLRIQDYDMTIEYRPGRDMLVADAMSRLPSNQHEPIDLDIKVTFVQFSSDKLSQLQQETKKDNDLSTLREFIVDGWPDLMKEMLTQLRQYWSYRDELSVENGMLLKGERIVIPRSMQQDILQQIHAGHQGAEKCSKLRAGSCVFWTSMHTDIDKVVHQCATCQEYQCTQPAETLRHLIVTDYYSKFPIFSEHSIPQRVVTDNGPQCDNETYRKFAKEWYFDHITSSPHYPKSNGFIERTVKTEKFTLKKAKSSKLDPYLALLCIRPTPVDNVLPSPAEMLYTKKVQGNLPVRMRNKLGNTEEIYERLQQRQEVQRTNHDQHSRDLSPLFPGQNVRIQTLPSSLWSPAVVREKCQEPRGNTKWKGLAKK